MSELRPPRPVAGLPEADGPALAKAWLVELVESLPLDDVARVPAADLAREAPMLCAAVAGAIGDDGLLAALAPGGRLAGVAARTGALAGVTDAPDAVFAAEALRRAISRQLLRAPGVRVDVLADAEDRLAHVTALIAAAAAAQAAEPADRAADATQSPTGAPTTAPRAAPVAAAPPETDLFRQTVPAAAPPADISVRRASDSDWLLAVGRALDDHHADGRPFALIAVELVDADRWLAADPGGEVAARTAATLAAVLPPEATLAVERPGRWWVVVRDADRASGVEAAHHLADRVRESDVPAALACGVASCPHDGETTEALVDRADTALFGARAAGVPVA